MWGLNSRPSRYQHDALPTELMDQLSVLSSDTESHFFPPLQDENAKLSEELLSTKTDLSAQLAQCEEVNPTCICVYSSILIDITPDSVQWACVYARAPCFVEADVKCGLLYGYIQHFWWFHTLNIIIYSAYFPWVWGDMKM